MIVKIDDYSTPDEIMEQGAGLIAMAAFRAIQQDSHMAAVDLLDPIINLCLEMKNDFLKKVVNG